MLRCALTYVASLWLCTTEVPLVTTEAHRDTGVAQLPPQKLPSGPWRISAHARAQRMGIGRFWGLGPQAPWQRQSSYSRAHASINIQMHRDMMAGLPGHNELMVGLMASYDILYGSAIASLPSGGSLHPKTPNIRGVSALALGHLTLRHNSVRPHTAHAHRGLWAEASLGASLGLKNAAPFVVAHVDVRRLFVHRHRVATAMRLFGRYVSASDAPFYMQSTVGGSHVLRGHSDGRFIDQGSWSFEVEERLHLWSSEVLGHHIAWHVDPYVGVGQVFHAFAPEQLFGAPQWVTGLGLRAVLSWGVARFDVASDLNRLRGTVGLGYPF